MAFGILEDEHLDSVPGTSLLSDYRHQTKIGHAASLKRGIGNQSHIILVPQPTDDPNEPLNWPKWKKEACFWTLSFATTLCGALSPLVGAGYVLLSMQFHVSVDEVASSFGALLLGLGCFMIVQNVLAVKFGHRIVYLGSVFLMFISCVWCALSPSLASIRASRVFQGFGMSSLQCLVPATIEQIYFVHERGSRSVIWNFCLMAGITLGPLLYSYVIKNMSWQMGFWFITIPLGLAGLLVFFFVPETSYASHENHMSRPSTHSQKNSLEDVGSPVGASSQSDEAPCPPIKSYASQLKIWNGTFNDAGITTLFFRPFPLLLSPITWFIFVSYCMQTVWLSLMPICSSTIFTIEYNFNATQIGLTNLGGIVGIVLATFISGPLTDWGTVWMSKHNKGVYEPEFRIVFMSTMLFGVFGYAGWAVGTTQNMHWIGAVACIAMVNFSMVVSGSAAVTYLLDTHRENALNILAVTNFIKNMILYGFTFFANGMIAKRGVKTSLLIFAGCQAACWLSCIPMYVYGKRVRSYIARHPQIFLVGKEGRQSRY